MLRTVCAAILALLSLSIGVTSVGAQLPDTPPESVLEVGQAWRQGNLELTLVQTYLIDTGVLCRLRLTNLGPDVPLQYTAANFSARDNLDRNVQTTATWVTWGVYVYYWRPSRPLEPVTTVARSGQIFDIPRDTYSNSLELVFNPADPDITEIVVTVSGISRIANARWRIPIAP